MFGYINLNSGECTEENKRIYQSYYCGLCRSLHAFCGAKGQLLLNYDMAFLAVLLTGLYEPGTEENAFNCSLHPLKKRYFCHNEIMDYAAQMNVLLAYYHLLDDWKDERKYSRKVLSSLLKRDYVRAADSYPRQMEAVGNYIVRLEECERRQEENIDCAAGLTGEMLGEVFAWKQDEWYNELKLLGYYMGKFIYLMDAYEDYERDVKKKLYNPLNFLEVADEQEFEAVCKIMMTDMMSECAKSFERLPILLHADILRNIIYSGVWSRYEWIQIKKKKRGK